MKCNVPNCPERSKKKLFRFPKTNFRLRIKWFLAIGLNPNHYRPSASLFVCENHFDLQKDLWNPFGWRNCHMKPQFKDNVVPHLNLNLKKVPPVKTPAPKSPTESVDPNCKNIQCDIIISKKSIGVQTDLSGPNWKEKNSENIEEVLVSC